MTKRNLILLSRTSTTLLNHALKLFTDNLNLVHILLTKLETESTNEDRMQLQGRVTGSLYLAPFFMQKQENSHCRSTCREVQHIDELSPTSAAHYPDFPQHSRNTSWHICNKQSVILQLICPSNKNNKYLTTPEYTN